MGAAGAIVGTVPFKIAVEIRRGNAAEPKHPPLEAAAGFVDVLDVIVAEHTDTSPANKGAIVIASADRT